MSDAGGRSALSWCCIGAQKAGTSTLFELLRQHPDLFIPPGKEVPLFHRPYDGAELSEYMSCHFAVHAVGGRKAGTVTPQYMSSPETAERLHRAFPEARIIALLRDPVRRAYSHHRMAVRRGTEGRTFAAAVADQIADLYDEGSKETDPDDEVATYVRRGLYGELLTPWFELFEDRRVHVVFTDDLENEPLGTVHEIHRFLEVQPFTSGDEGVRRHADPPRHRFPNLRRGVTGPLRRAGLLDRVPGHVRERLGYRVESALAKVAPPQGGEEPGVDPATETRLREVYAPDGQALEKLLGRPVPWRS